MLRTYKTLSLMLMVSLALPTGIMAMDSDPESGRRLTLEEDRANRSSRSQRSLAERHPYLLATGLTTLSALTGGLVVYTFMSRTTPAGEPQTQPDTRTAKKETGPLALAKSGGKMIWSGGKIACNGLTQLGLILFASEKFGFDFSRIFGLANFGMHLQGMLQRTRIEDGVNQANNGIGNLADDHIHLDATTLATLAHVEHPDYGLAEAYRLALETGGRVEMVEGQVVVIESLTRNITNLVTDDTFGLRASYDALAEVRTYAQETNRQLVAVTTTQAAHTDSLASITARIESLQTELDGLRTETRTTGDEARAHARTTNSNQASMQEQLRAIRADIETLQTELAQLPTTTTDTNTRVRAMQAELTNHGKQIDELHRRHDSGPDDTDTPQ